MRNRAFKLNDFNTYYVNPPHNMKSTNKINSDKFFIPKIHEYNKSCEHNYNVSQLKTICKHYKLKVTGTKDVLFEQIYNYLRMSHYCSRIQKVFRGKLQRKCRSYQGPALMNRRVCVNETDFYTLQNIHEIPVEQFFSYTDSDNFVYGFDILSIYTLLNTRIKKPKKRENPYNRKELPKFVKQNIIDYLLLCKCMKINVITTDEDETENICPAKQVEFKALELFQHIDQLGNYTQPVWFLSLSKNQLIMYVRELYDIWNYRANLSNSTKRNIYPPSGDPFRHNNIVLLNNNTIIEIQNSVLQIMSNFTKSAHTSDNQSLGAFYVLAALTLVNSDAAEALPWLYQSVSHF